MSKFYLYLCLYLLISYLKFHWGLPFNYMSDLRLVLNYYRNKIDYTVYPFFGDVERVEGNHIEKNRITDKAKYYFYNESDQVNVSTLGVEFINRIASLTEQFNINLTIISTPMHPYFIQQIPEEIQQTYNKTIKTVLQNYVHIKFIDSSHFPINEDMFLDGDHLNVRGLAKYSQFLVKEHLNKNNDK